MITYSIMETKPNNTPEEIHQVIDAASRILLISHRKPDGDTLGANLGLYHYIKNLLDKEIVIFCVDTPASVYKFMPGIEMLSSRSFALITAAIVSEYLKSPSVILLIIFGNILFWFLVPKKRNILKRLIVLIISVLSAFALSALLDSLYF